MQVQYETQLLAADYFKPNVCPNVTLDSYTLSQSVPLPIERLVCSPVENQIAVHVSNSNQVTLIDTKTSRGRDKFPLKPCDKKYSRLSFTVKGLDFSPDGARIAVGQTDCIIYIYRLSNHQVDMASTSKVASGINKPTITGKFICSSPITCLSWIEHGIVFGSQDGKVKLISTVKSNSDQQSLSSSSTKVTGLYSSPKNTMPISIVYKSPYLVVGFADGGVLIGSISFENTNAAEQNPLESINLNATWKGASQPQLHVTLLVHSCPPICLSIIQSGVLCCAGADGRLAIHGIQLERPSPSSSGKLGNFTGAKLQQSLKAIWMQNIEFKESVESMYYSTINDILALATSKRIMFVKYDRESSSWQRQTSFIEFDNPLLIISSLVWSRDGSQIILGTSIGSVESFKCSWNKQSVGEQLEICHIAKNKVCITDRARNLLATYKTKHDIKRVNLLHDGQNVIIWTSGSLLLAQLGQPNAQSEIPWPNNRDRGATKFSFENPGFVLICNNPSCELKIVRFGEDKVAYTINLDTIPKSHTVCVRCFPSRFHATAVGKVSSAKGSELQRKPSIAEGPRPQESEFEVLNQPVSEVNEYPETDSVERLVYVVQRKQLMVLDLKSQTNQLTYRHQEAIDWVRLSHTANHLLVRDSQCKLYLIDLSSATTDRLELRKQQIVLLLERCEFAKWLRHSDILIAQSEYKIFIWYNIKELNNKVYFDSRSYNFSGTAPIMDLSFAKESQRQKPYPILLDDSRDPSSKLRLSNGSDLQLDVIKVKFYTELCIAASRRHQLAAAFEVLESYQMIKPSDKSLPKLWNKLGWLAIERIDCRIALHAFDRLQYRSLINFLQKCLAQPLEEQQWRLAMLRGDWKRFEQLRESEQIIATYKRLNKWTNLIDYLTSTQQFRQRDMAEQERIDWLVSSGRHLEAAQIRAKAGDLSEAIDLLMKNKLYEASASLLIEHQSKTPLRARPLKSGAGEFQINLKLEQVAKELKDRLIGDGQYNKAALLCDKVLCDHTAAMELYLKGCNFEIALQLARHLGQPEKVIEIEALYGQHLMTEYNNQRISRRRALRAIDHFEASNMPEKALEVAIHLGEFYLALKQLQNMAIAENQNESSAIRNKLRDYSKLVAENFIKKGESNHAIEALLSGRHYKQVVGIHLELGEFEKAFELSTEFVHGNDRTKAASEFNRLADRMADEGEWDKAERMYLLLNRADAALDMHKRAGNHSKMLDIVERFFPDLLESTLLLLAKESESSGCYEEAEQYLLRASKSEWTNVVRMYRLVNKWSDAYRVASENCVSKRDPLLVQLVYWWCKSLMNDENGPSKAYQLIERLEVADEVIDFACENRNFQLAIDICTKTANEPPNDEVRDARQRRLTKRYATYLERQHKFDKAEEVLVAGQQIREAARMYLDNGMYSDALRVVEDHIRLSETALSDTGNASRLDPEMNLQELLSEILVESANRIAAEVGSQPKSRASFLINGGGVEPSQLNTDEEKLTRAQQLYLRAGRPDLVVELYKEREMWQQAVQVAQRFAPQLLESVELALDAKASQDLEPIISKMAPISSDLFGHRLGHPSIALLQQQQQSVSEGNATNGTKPPVPETRSSQISRPSSNEKALLNKAEVSMRIGDVRETRAALGKFLENLVDGSKSEHGDTQLPSSSNIAEAHLEELESAASIMLASFTEDTQIEQRVAAAQQVVGKANQLAQSCSWGRWRLAPARDGIKENSPISTGSDLLIWQRARDLLAACTMQLQRAHEEKTSNLREPGRRIPLTRLFEQLQRRLMACHYIVLHGYLAGQLQISIAAAQGYKSTSGVLPIGDPSPGKMDRLAAISSSNHQSEVRMSGGPSNETILNLLSRLSLSLLRYTDFINLSNALYAIGLWLVAARRSSLAQFIWSRLIELIESGSLASNESDRDQLIRADVPLGELNQLSNATAGCGELNPRQVSEIRRWLLESLIGEKAPNRRGSAHSATLDGRGLWESSLRESYGSTRLVEPCLACGYPLLADDPDQLRLEKEEMDEEVKPASRSGGSTSRQVHLSEWRDLKLMSNQKDEEHLLMRGSVRQTVTGPFGADRRSESSAVDRFRLSSQIGDFINWLGGISNGLQRSAEPT